MPADLKPCPFCGNEKPVFGVKSKDAYTLVYYVYCVVCDASFFDTVLHDPEHYVRVVDAWNKRTGQILQGG